MLEAEIVSQVNIAELLGLADIGLDDADADAQSNVFISDGVNGRVYKIHPDGVLSDSFEVMRPNDAGEGVETSLNLAAAPDSTFCVADVGNASVVRYGADGRVMGEFPAPGVISLCHGPEGLFSVLSSCEGKECIHLYDYLGSRVESLPAPARSRARLDAAIVNLDCDHEGNVFVSYGMPPYRVWRVSADGSEMTALGRDIDYPEDALLVADIAVDPVSGGLWVLLALKQAGRQILDFFSGDGDFVGSAELPHSNSLYGVLCASAGSQLNLLDTGSGPGAGSLVRVRVSP